MHQPSHYVSFNTSHHPRAYVNSVVRFHHPTTIEQRIQAAEQAGWNVFQFPSELLEGGDLLSDSGTTTMTAEQVAAMWHGDEAYGSNYGYFKIRDVFAETFGLDLAHTELYLFHQGRATEHALFTQAGTWGKQIIPSNGHFDTTRANIEANHIQAIDCFGDDLHDTSNAPFKGNLNLEKLESLLSTQGDRIPMVYITITNNTGGGQPVSFENIKAVKALCQTYNKPFMIDACRFAENAYFIQQREAGMHSMSVRDIVKQIFALCDGFTISLKKDGLANMGGALVIKTDGLLANQHPEMLNHLRDHQILTEGHPTYGGLSGRDIMTIVEGLKTVVTEQYLAHRIGQVQQFGQYLVELGIPVVQPFGGHAVYIDMDQFFAGTKHKREDYGGIAFTALLLLKGVRLCELGVFAFGLEHPHNFVRCAIPRNKYEIQDLYYVADCIKGLYDQRSTLPRAVPTFGGDLTLRHFKAKFKLEPIS